MVRREDEDARLGRPQGVQGPARPARLRADAGAGARSTGSRASPARIEEARNAGRLKRTPDVLPPSARRLSSRTYCPEPPGGLRASSIAPVPAEKPGRPPGATSAGAEARLASNVPSASTRLRRDIETRNAGRNPRWSSCATVLHGPCRRCELCFKRRCVQVWLQDARRRQRSATTPAANPPRRRRYEEIGPERTCSTGPALYHSRRSLPLDVQAPAECAHAYSWSDRAHRNGHEARERRCAGHRWAHQRSGAGASGAGWRASHRREGEVGDARAHRHPLASRCVSQPCDERRLGRE